MNKFLSFLKRNKKKVIVFLVLLIIFGIFVYATYKLFAYLTPDTKNSVYGNRCELTEGIEITKDRKEMIKKAVEEYEGMTLTTVDVKCNLIDILVKVEDEISLETVKEMSTKLLSIFTEEELKYYDLELWVDSNNKESEVYPVIGTRHKTGNGDATNKFVW